MGLLDIFKRKNNEANIIGVTPPPIKPAETQFVQDTIIIEPVADSAQAPAAPPNAEQKKPKRRRRRAINISAFSYKTYVRLINKANTEYDAIIANALDKKNEIEKQALTDIRNQKRELEHDLQRLQDTMREIEMIIGSHSVDPWEKCNLSKNEYAEKAKILKDEIKKLIDNKRAAENIIPFSTNEEIKTYDRRYKQIVRCFCAEADAIISQAPEKTFGVSNRKLAKAFTDINRLFEKDNIAVSDLLYDLKFQQCVAVYYSKNEK